MCISDETRFVLRSLMAVLCLIAWKVEQAVDDGLSR